MKTVLAILVGSAGVAVVIAWAILRVGHWQIAAAGESNDMAVYRLDRWTGEVVYCESFPSGRGGVLKCPDPGV